MQPPAPWRYALVSRRPADPHPHQPAPAPLPRPRHREGTGKAEEPWVHAADAWWSLRSFVLREDLSLDYDVGGLGVSATFFIVLASFVVAIAQVRSVVVRSVGRSVAVRGARHRRGGVRCRGLVWLGYRASVAHEVYGQP